jgi:hypothetical protein
MTDPGARPQAPQYLLALQTQLDEVRARPPVSLKFCGFLALGVMASSGPLVVQVIRGEFGLSGILMPGLALGVLGAVAAPFVLEWRREIRRLEREIALFDPPEGGGDPAAGR